MWEYNQQMPPDELYHFGVMGMKWGVHRSGGSGSGSGGSSKRQIKKTHDKNAVETLKKNRGADKGPVNVSNSAARTYYRKQNNQRKSANSHSFYKSQQYAKKAAKQEMKLDRKQAGLTPEQIKAGRYRVARARNYKRTAASVAIASASTVATGAALVSAAAALPITVAAGAGVAGTSYITSRYATGGRRYRREQISYSKYAKNNM